VLPFSAHGFAAASWIDLFAIQNATSVDQFDLTQSIDFGDSHIRIV
jgi:hypothetical protein